jgi:Uma2 family endonuclease
VGLPLSIDPSEVARITRAQYDAIVASGALDDVAVELLEGVIVEMSPQGLEHAAAIETLADLLRRALGERARVREEKPFAADDASEPEPDVAVVAPGDPFAALPAYAHLIVEVAETSLRKDRGAKAAAYARAGVPEYWIVNLRDRVVEIHLDPRGDRYSSITIARPGERIAPRAFPDAQLEVALFLR